MERLTSKRVRRVAAAAFAGASVLLVSAAYGGTQARDSLTAGSSAADASPAPSPKVVVGGPDPDQGKSIQQLDDEQAAQFAEFEKKYAAWESSPAVLSMDWHSLAQHEITGHYHAGYSSFEESMDHADVVVLGHVLSNRPNGYETDTVFAVERSSKEQPPATITVDQSGGVRPTSDYSGAYLSVSGGRPFLFPGDRAVLLLKRSSLGDGKYLIQSVSGEYRSTAGHLRSASNNRFKDADGVSESDLMDRADRHANKK